MTVETVVYTAIIIFVVVMLALWREFLVIRTTFIDRINGLPDPGDPNFNNLMRHHQSVTFNQHAWRRRTFRDPWAIYPAEYRQARRRI